MEKLNKLIKLFFNREVISYLIFGVLTTVVNIATSTILDVFFHVEGNLASTIGIIVCILFAYFTNRKWVFPSQAHTKKEKLNEFGKFVLGRSVTMVIEIIGFYILYTVFSIQFFISKCTITILVIILNYFISKFFTFK